MRYTLPFVTALVSTAVAVPIVTRQAPAASSANSLQDMIKGATEFSPAFLAGDQKGAANALNGMLNGAASFTPGFFNDLGKAAGGARPSRRQAPAPAAPAGGLSTATSIADMVGGATAFSPKVVQGDAQGAATALAQMLGGAASFTPGFFSDLLKGVGGAAPSTKRQAPAAAPPASGLSTSTSINDMVQGAVSFSPKVVAGDAQGAATSLAQMLGGAVSFTPGFFSDLLKGSAGQTAQTAGPKPA